MKCSTHKFQIVDYCCPHFFLFLMYSHINIHKSTYSKKSVLEVVVLGHKHRQRINMKTRGSAISAKWVPIFSVFSFILGMIITTRSLYLDRFNFFLHKFFIRFFSVLWSCLLYFTLLNWNTRVRNLSP